jgi:hypothetical protein
MLTNLTPHTVRSIATITVADQQAKAATNHELCRAPLNGLKAKAAKAAAASSDSEATATEAQSDGGAEEQDEEEGEGFSAGESTAEVEEEEMMGAVDQRRDVATTPEMDEEEEDGELQHLAMNPCRHTDDVTQH